MATTGIFRPTVLASALLAAGLALPILGLAATITVTGAVDDTLANLAGNGTCDLREAIQSAMTAAAVGECGAGAPGADTIAFNIPGAGMHVIAIAAAAGHLPDLISAVTIDGYTQPGSAVNTAGDGSSNAQLMVGIDGGNNAGIHGFRMSSG